MNETNKNDNAAAPASQVGRLVMCVGTWPEDNYADFVVFPVQPGESDQDALCRAAIAYGDDNEFYIK